MSKRADIEWAFRKKLAMNGLLFCLCALFTIGLIQHAMFFYSFPPDPDRYVIVNPMAYLVLTIILFISFKLSHYLAEKGEIIGDGG